MKILLLFNFLGPEMLIIFFAILLLFGGKKIPELMRGIGRGISEFNNARSSLERELQDGAREDEQRRLREQRERQASASTPPPPPTASPTDTNTPL